MPADSRHPNQACRDYARQDCDEDGRPLQFYNVSLSGGFVARFAPSELEGTMFHEAIRMGAIFAGVDIAPSGPVERAIAGLLVAAYKRRLRGIVELVPNWMANRMLTPPTKNW